ncbi:MAG: SPFH domain-containing protein [Planctomycetota bacterium]|nr:SPFH domain-containing protein [Planctomycetota bacterium]
MKVTAIASSGLLLLAGLGIFARLCVVKVRIGQVGVLTEEWGSGLQQEDYPPGFHFNLGPLHSWELFDSTVQTLSMIDGDPNGPLNVKSRDGQTVILDVTIKFRIKPGECWKLRQELGTGDYYKTKVRNEAIDAMRPVFGSMLTEDFYDPKKRTDKAAESETLLRRRLASLHVELVAILVRDVTFNLTYEKELKLKALKDQEREVNNAQREAAQFRGNTQIIEAATQAKVTVIKQTLEKTRRELTADNEKEIAKIRADAARYVVETHADADLFKAEKQASANLLTKNAEAEAQRLRQTALQGSGAKNLVALEAAKNLNLTKIIISTLDNNVLDLPSLAKKLGSATGK